MKLDGWTWLISGTIIAIMSGFVYLTIPKNGQPNISMAIFFFIGIIFIVIGIAKLFFKRRDDQSMIDSMKAAESQPRIVTMPPASNMNNVMNTNNIDSGSNRIDATIAQMMQQEQSKQTSNPMQGQQKTHPHTQTHTNSFSKIYEYKGPTHTPTTATHAQHPVAQHTNPQHHVQNAEHSIKCRRCGNANSGSSNYCHQCGNRLK